MPKAIYTKENVLEAIAAFHDKYGYAPIYSSGLIEGNVELANGVRTWKNVGQAFIKGRIKGLLIPTTMEEFIKDNGFKKKPRELDYTYTKTNVLEAIKAYEEKHGYAPDEGSGVIEWGVKLSNGKRTWRDVYHAFNRGLVYGEDKNTTMNDFIVMRGFKVKSSIYTIANVLEAMYEYVRLNNYAPTKNSGLVEGNVELADGTRTWENIYKAFVNKIVAGTSLKTMSIFAKENGFKIDPNKKKPFLYSSENVLDAINEHIRINGDPPSVSSGIIKGNTVLANGLRTWNNVSLAFTKNRVENVKKGTSFAAFKRANDFEKKPKKNVRSKTKKSTKKKLKKRRSKVVKDKNKKAVKKSISNLRDIFDVVRMHILLRDLYLKSSNIGPHLILFDLTNPSNLETSLSQHLIDSLKVDATNYSWGKIVDKAHSGKISGLDKTFNIAVFASHIEKRIQEYNYTSPDVDEVKQWMSNSL